MTITFDLLWMEQSNYKSVSCQSASVRTRSGGDGSKSQQ